LLEFNVELLLCVLITFIAAVCDARLDILVSKSCDLMFINDQLMWRLD
jgi:hypothetical protein